MFYNCKSLETAPYLPAENLSSGCYQRMFYGCSSLRLIKMNARNYTNSNKGAFISDNTTWVNGVAGSGEIWLNPAIKNSNGYQSIVPTGSGWSIKSLPDGGDWN